MSWLAVMDEMASVLRSAFADVQYAGQDIGLEIEPRLVVNPSTACIDIYPADPPQETESAGFNASGVDGGWVFTVRARVGTADNVAGQELLIAFMDETNELCVAVALMENETLNGLATDVTVEPPTGYGLYPSADGQGSWLGCQWRATVQPDRTVT